MCACSNLLKSIASAFSVPVLAATLSFVAYTSTSHAFNVATIFSSLALFNLLRQPLMFMPRALSATTDAQNALERLKALFLAELNEGEAFIVDPAQPVGLLVEDATFEWEESPSAREIKEGDGKKGNKKEKAAVKGDVTPVPEQSAPFQVKEVNMSIQRGTLAAVVGSVGSGKVRTQPVSVARIGRGLMRPVVESSARPYRGDAQSSWACVVRRQGRILFSDGLDTERYVGTDHVSCRPENVLTGPCRKRMSYSANRTKKSG